jgi:hypothetical protein
LEKKERGVAKKSSCPLRTQIFILFTDCTYWEMYGQHMTGASDIAWGGDNDEEGMEIANNNF